MKYEIILLDQQSQISDEALDFVRKMQQFIELNFKESSVVKFSMSEDFTHVFPLDGSESLKLLASKAFSNL